MKKRMLVAMTVAMFAIIAAGCDSANDDGVAEHLIDPALPQTEAAADDGSIDVATVPDDVAETEGATADEAQVELADVRKEPASLMGSPAALLQTPHKQICPLAILTTELGPVFAGIPFDIELEACGAGGQYSWKIEKFQKKPIGKQPCLSIEECKGKPQFSRNFNLSIEHGVLKGSIPDAGTYEVVLSLSDAEGNMVTSKPIELKVIQPLLLII
jgi:hypothetical protein